MAQQPNPHNAQLANLEPGEAATTAAHHINQGDHKHRQGHPKITGSWMLGLALVVFATGFPRLRRGVSILRLTSRPLICPNLLVGRPRACGERAKLLNEAPPGWFSCDDRCQYHKGEAETASRATGRLAETREDAGLSDAKKGQVSSASTPSRKLEIRSDARSLETQVVL